MTIIKNEIFKLISKKSLLFLILVLLAINAVTMLFSGNKFGEDNYEIPDTAYKLMQRELEKIPENERLQYIEDQIYAGEIYSALRLSEELSIDMPVEELFPVLCEEKAQQYIERYSRGENTLLYTGSAVGEELFLSKIKGEIEKVYGYNDYLDEIQKQAERMDVSSIFGKSNSFSRKNIEKTALAYSNIEKKELPYNITENIRLGLNGNMTDICAILGAVFVVLSLICGEREISAFSLLRTLKKGRGKLMLCKILTIFLFCLVSSFLFTGSNLLICGMRFGFCDISMPIQSVSGFIGCTLNVNIGQYLMLFIILKTLSYFAISSVVLFVSITAKNNIMIYSISSCFIGIEALLYYSIDRLSVLGFLKYINLFAVTRTNDFLGEYHNINFADTPINLTVISVVSMLVSAIGLTVLSVFFYSRPKNIVYSSYRISALLGKIKPFGKRISVSLAAHECYKIFISEKGIIILLLMIAASCYFYTSFSVIPDESDGYFRQFVKEYGGIITEETDEFVKDKVIYFERLLNETDMDNPAAAVVLRQKNGFDIFAERYYYAKENGLKIIYDTGYCKICESKNTLMQLLLLFAFMSVIFAPVFSFDSKTSPLIISTKHGRKKNILTRGIICGVIAIFMFFAAHLPIFIKIFKIYGMDGINSSVYAVSAFRNFPFDISVLWFLILRYICLIILTLGVMTAMLFISRRMKSTTACTIMLIALFVVPLAAWLWLIS